MDNLVSIKNGKVFTTSMQVFEAFDEKSHRNILKKIDRMTAQNGAVLKMFKETTYTNSQNRNFRMFEMNRDGFALLVMSFTGEKALEWKLKFIEAFNLMEQKLLNQSNVQWLEAREQGKIVRKEETDTIKDFVEYATKQGSRNAKMYYANITKMEYKALELIQQKDEKIRDSLNIVQLNQLFIAEKLCTQAIKQGMEDNLHYKEIYIYAKDAILNYADSIKMIRLH